MEEFLTENPEAFRKYFSGLVKFVNGSSRILKDIQSRDLSRFSLLVPVDGEATLERGDYIQGQFFVPEEGWKMLDGEFQGLDSLIVEGKERPAIQLRNSSKYGTGAGTNEVVAVSNVSELGNPIWGVE